MATNPARKTHDGVIASSWKPKETEGVGWWQKVGRHLKDYSHEHFVAIWTGVIASLIIVAGAWLLSWLMVP